MKKFHVEVFYPALPSPIATQTKTEDGSRISVAIKRALDDIRTRPGIKGKRLKSCTITCVEIE